MLQPETLKAIFQNALLMAFADGELHPTQRAFLEELMAHGGIDRETALGWRAELERDALAFRPVREEGAAAEVARVAIGAAAANGVFHEREKLALLELGKAIGLDRDELKALVRETFGRDVLAEVFGRASEPPRAEAWVLTDDWPRHEAFLEAATPLDPRARGVREALAEPGFEGVIFFHVREATARSEERLRALARQHPRARLVFIAERAQAFQIGYLLDAGAAGCLVAPVYPEEISALLARIERDGR